MQARIGKGLVDELVPASQPYEVVDTELRGFLIRVQPSGSMSYYFSYRNTQGKRRRFRIGAHGTITAPQARDVAKGLAKRVASGEDIHEVRKAARREAKLSEARTLRGFIDQKYRPWAEANQKRGKASVDRIVGRFEHILEQPIDQITAWQLEKWRNQRLKQGIARSTVNRDIAGLRACMSKAVEWGVVGSHSLTGLKLLRVDRLPRVRFLNPEEERRLRSALESRDKRIRTERRNANRWREIRGYPLKPKLHDGMFPDHLHPMVLLSLNAGLRRGESLSLQWDDIDLDRKLLSVRGEASKSGHTRYVPLGEEALRTLRKWRNSSPSKTQSDLVFPGKNGAEMGSLKTAWTNLLAAAKISGFRWHDMRHHFASMLVMAGVDLSTVRELLGHQSLEMTLRYAHLSRDHKAEAIEKLNMQRAMQNA